jgi:hypothetical protein
LAIRLALSHTTAKGVAPNLKVLLIDTLKVLYKDSSVF